MSASLKKERDPTLDHPAVKLVRDTFRFCPSPYWRQAIVVTAEQDFNLWKSVIKEWATPYYDAKGKRKFRNPLDYKHMLSEFDRRWFDSKANGNVHI